MNNTKINNESMQLLTVDTLAQLLAVSGKKVRRLDLMGKIPRPLKIGHSLRWRRTEILAWLNADSPDRETWETIKREGAAERFLHRPFPPS